MDERLRFVARLLEGEAMTDVCQARRKAEALRGQVRDDRDPVAERKAALAATLAAEAQAKAAAVAASYTVTKLIGDWNMHHPAERSPSYRARVPGELRRALADWLDAPADSFSRVNAVRALDVVKAESGPVAANRLRAAARACWQLARSAGWLPSRRPGRAEGSA